MRPSAVLPIATFAPPVAAPPASATAATVVPTTAAAASAVSSFIQCFIEDLLVVVRRACEPRVEVGRGRARERSELAQVPVRRLRDADDQLARVGLAVDAAEQLVADRLGEPVGSVRPAGDRPARCGE